MEVFKTTAGCNYKEYAYVIPVTKDKDNKDYLCLYTNQTGIDSIYKIGEIVRNLDEYYLKEAKIDINSFPISKTFLFQFFIKNYK